MSSYSLRTAGGRAAVRAPCRVALHLGPRLLWVRPHTVCCAHILTAVWVLSYTQSSHRGGPLCCVARGRTASSTRCSRISPAFMCDNSSRPCCSKRLRHAGFGVLLGANRQADECLSSLRAPASLSSSLLQQFITFLCSARHFRTALVIIQSINIIVRSTQYLRI